MRGYGDDPWRNAMQGVGFLGDAMRTGQQIGEVRHEQDERDARIRRMSISLVNLEVLGICRPLMEIPS